MNTLAWRGRCPTAVSFLMLFHCRWPKDSSDKACCLSAYLVELAMTDCSLVAVPYSVVAASALLLARGLLHEPLQHQQLVSLLAATHGCNAAQRVHECCSRLLELHQGMSPDALAEASKPLAPIREKYAQASCCRASLLPTVASLQAAGLSVLLDSHTAGTAADPGAKKTSTHLFGATTTTLYPHVVASKSSTPPPAATCNLPWRQHIAAPAPEVAGH